MAVSGTQFTRIGAHMSAVGIKLTITAKAAGVAAVEVSVSLTRGLTRGLTVGLTRGITEQEDC